MVMLRLWACVGLLAVGCKSRQSAKSPPDSGADSLPVREQGLPAEIIAHRDEIMAAIKKAGVGPSQRVARSWDAHCPDAPVFTLARGCQGLPHSRVRLSYEGRPVLVMSNEQVTGCRRGSAALPEDDEVVMSVDLPPGAHSAPVAARPVAARARLEYPDGGWDIADGGASVVIIDPAPLQAGEPLRGELVIEGLGKGKFSAELCPGVLDAVTQPPSLKPAEKLRVTAGGKLLRGPVSAVMHTFSSDRRRKPFIALFEGHATCEWETDLALSIYPPAVDSPFSLAGTWQPAAAAYPILWHGVMWEAYGWARWDQMPLAAGAKVEGRVLIETPPDARSEESLTISGPISALVCPET